MRKIRFEREAYEEMEFALDESLAEYGEVAFKRFEMILSSALLRAQEHPESYVQLEGNENLRRITLRERPYYLVYSWDKDFINVIAFVHERTRPGSWK